MQASMLYLVAKYIVVFYFMLTTTWTRDVTVEGLENHVWVDLLQGEPGSLNLRQTNLVWRVEKTRKLVAKHHTDSCWLFLPYRSRT